MTDRVLKLVRLEELFPGQWSNIERLHRLLSGYDRLQELLCNGCGWWHGYDVETYNYDMAGEEISPIMKAEQRLEGRIIALVVAIDPALTVEFQGDPRGYCVKISQGSNMLSWLFYY